MTTASPLRVAVLGTGAIGHNHIQQFKEHPAAEVVAIAETSAARGKEAVEKHGIAHHTTDYRELLARPDIDIVSIALPNYLHARVGLEALRAGKHVMLEKPMATNAAEGQLLADAANLHGVKLMVGQNMRFEPEVQTAKALIDDGKIGTPYHAKTCWLRRSGIPRIGSWFTQKQFSGGGCCYDIGAHALDRALFLMGEFEVASVSGQTFTQLGNRGLGDGNWGKSEIDAQAPFDVDDLALALIKLKSGRTVLLETSWAVHQLHADSNETQIFGTEGGLYVPQLRLVRPTSDGYTVETVETTQTAVNPNRMAHFVDYVLGKSEPFVTVEQSLVVQRILDAIYASSDSGREVAFA